MKFFLKIILTFLLLFCCFSCSQKAAKIIDNSRNSYGKNKSISKSKTNYSNNVSQSNLDLIEVKEGETLYSVSKKYNISLRDLIKENDLTPPYNLKSGTKLKTSSLTSQKIHEVKNGETLYSISRTYNMRIDDLVEINDLPKPYNVRVGDKIKIVNDNSLPPTATKEVIITKTTFDTKNLSKAQNLPFASNVVDKNAVTINPINNNIAAKNEASKPIASKTITPKPDTKTLNFSAIEKSLDRFNHFSWPIKGPVISKFGPKSGGLYNDGINIKAKEGDEVSASEDGMVAYVGNELKGYGNLIIVKHSSGWITAYAHLKNSLVKRGQKVNKGDKIAIVGSTGNVTSPQLYFGLRKGRDAVNPQNYLK